MIFPSRKWIAECLACGRLRTREEGFLYQLEQCKQEKQIKEIIFCPSLMLQ